MKKLFIVVVIWGLILAGAGAAYYYLVMNPVIPGLGETTVLGKVVSAEKGKLTATVGGKDKTYEIPDAAAVTIDGKAARVEEVKKDSTVTVTLKDDVVTKVEAKDSGTTSPGGPPPLKLALDSFSGYCIFRSDEFKKKLAEQGINLECVDDKADYPARMKTVQSGETPLAVFTIDALINNTPPSGSPPATIIMAIDETRGADAMIGLAPGTPDVASLNRADQKIVLVEGSPSETLARVVRSQFKLPDLPPLKKNFLISAKDSEIDDVYNQFCSARATEHKAFVLWEPFVSKALQKRPKEAVVLVDSSKFKGYIVDVLVAQQSWLHAHPTEAKAVVQSYLEILHTQQSAGGMAALVLSDSVDKLGVKLTQDEAGSIAKGIWWKNTMENYAHFGVLPKEDAKGLQQVDEMIKNISIVLDQTKQPGEPSPPGETVQEGLYDKSTVQGLYDQRPSFMIGKETIWVEPVAAGLSDADWGALQSVGVFKEDPIEFKRGSAATEFSDVTDAQFVLLEVAEQMRRWPQYYLRVEGNTEGEDTDLNRKNAQGRADVVRDFLVNNLGQDPQRIRAVGNRPGKGKQVNFVMLQKAR